MRLLGTIIIYGAYKETLNSVKLQVSAEHQQELDKLDSQLAHAVAKKHETRVMYLAEWKDTDLPESEKDQWTIDYGWDTRVRASKVMLMSVLSFSMFTVVTS